MDEARKSETGDSRFVFICAKPQRDPSYQVLSDASALSFHYRHILVSPLTGPELGRAMANVTQEEVSCGTFWEIATLHETFGVRKVASFTPSGTPTYPMCGVEYCGETFLNDDAIADHGWHMGS